MLLKRKYDRSAPADKWIKVRRQYAVNNADGTVLFNASGTPAAVERDVLVPPVLGVEIKRMPLHAKQHFTPRLVEGGRLEGWLTLTGGVITIHAEGGDVRWKVLHKPGRYCCHCAMKLPDDPTGVAARMHIVEKHAGVTSPDPHHPAGYCCNNYFDCVLEGVPNG